MKHFYKKVLFTGKSKKPSLAIHGPGPATSTSTSDPIPSIPTSGVTEEVIHQATGASVGFQDINNLPPVSVPAAGINLVHHNLLNIHPH